MSSTPVAAREPGRSSRGCVGGDDAVLGLDELAGERRLPQPSSSASRRAPEAVPEVAGSPPRWPRRRSHDPDDVCECEITPIVRDHVQLAWAPCIPATRLREEIPGPTACSQFEWLF